VEGSAALVMKNFVVFVAANAAQIQPSLVPSASLTQIASEKSFSTLKLPASLPPTSIFMNLLRV